MGSGLDRFFYGYRYDPNTAINFSKDLKLLPKTTTQLVVSPDELAFYKQSRITETTSPSRYNRAAIHLQQPAQQKIISVATPSTELLRALTLRTAIDSTAIKSYHSNV